MLLTHVEAELWEDILDQDWGQRMQLCADLYWICLPNCYLRRPFHSSVWLMLFTNIICTLPSGEAVLPNIAKLRFPNCLQLLFPLNALQSQSSFVLSWYFQNICCHIETVQTAGCGPCLSVGILTGLIYQQNTKDYRPALQCVVQVDASSWRWKQFYVWFVQVLLVSAWL